MSASVSENIFKCSLGLFKQSPRKNSILDGSSYSNSIYNPRIQNLLRERLVNEEKVFRVVFESLNAKWLFKIILFFKGRLKCFQIVRILPFMNGRQFPVSVLNRKPVVDLRRSLAKLG